MRLVSRLFVPCSLLLACGRSSIDGPDELPSVVDLSTGGSSGSGAGGSLPGGQGGSLAGSAGAENIGGSAGAGNAAGSAGAGNVAGFGGSAGAGAAGAGGGSSGSSGFGGSGGSGGFGGGGSGGFGGSGGSGGFGGSGGAVSCPGGVIISNGFCQSCIDGACCGESQGCRNDKECNGLLQCLLSCGDDPSCQESCVNQFPGGIPRLQLLGECVESSCAFACSGEGGAGGTAGSGGSAGAAGSGGFGGGGSGGAGGSANLCGDGKLGPGETCDDGPKNTDTSALLLLVNGAAIPVTPLDRSGTAQSFYNYFSASSHTGFEEVGASRIMLHRNVNTGQMSLVLHHGIDFNTSGQQQPSGKVQMKISGPESMFVIFADDNQQELSMVGPGTVSGNWTFTNNSDGGILGGFPLPGDWNLDISPFFQQGIQSWAFVDGSGKLRELGINGSLTLQSRSSSQGLCRLDCTVPTCGDGRLDAGEQCDDGNQSNTDGCRSDCTLGF
jgi:cysteine-rich repeat protein